MKPIYKYKRYWEDTDDIQIELTCFREKLSVEEGGLGRLGHYQEICKMLWPDHKASEWSDTMQREFCGESIHPGRPLNVVVTGPGSASKSTEAAKFCVVWQLMAPLNTAIPVTSTSVKMARKRIWSEIKAMRDVAAYHCRTKFGYELPGNLVDSACELQGAKGDSKHAIAIVPGSQQYISEGKAKLYGWHAEYVLIIADELQDMTEEVIDACVNMASGTNEFIFIGLGNGQSWFNTLGKAMMPKSGNPESVDAEMEKWETADGICVHLDGLKSPNVTEPGKYPWLVSQEQINKVIAKHGEDSIQYWQMIRGFPPPDGTIHAVVPESMMVKFNCLQSDPMVGSWEEYAGLDPAFGGDGCVLKFAKIGVFTDIEKIGINFTDKIEIKTQANSKEPVDFQIANKVMLECKARGINPRNFSGDGTGTGRGVMAIIRQQWSNDIHVTEFGGAASDLPVSDLDYTMGHEAYCNKATELWFAFRTFVMNGQVRGITQMMARGFGSRTYTTKGKRALIQSKDEVRKTLGRSPDEEDASVTIIENLRNQGFLAGGGKGFDEGWDTAIEKNLVEGEYAATDEMLIS